MCDSKSSFQAGNLVYTCMQVCTLIDIHTAHIQWHIHVYVQVRMCVCAYRSSNANTKVVEFLSVVYVRAHSLVYSLPQLLASFPTCLVPSSCACVLSPCTLCDFIYACENASSQQLNQDSHT